jgi:regulator of protease activity HflC (stomatin/prohibitin superfamily)
MNALFEWVARVVSSWRFWIVVAPWDIGIRIRLGKMAAALQPGFHFRIPFVDEITLVNTRIRMDTTPTVTVKGSKPSTSKVITATVGYAIVDPLKAMLEYSYPGVVLTGFAQEEIVAGTPQEEIKEKLNQKVSGNGIRIDFVYFSENVEVRTYRLINNNGGGFYGGPMHPGEEGTKKY